MATVTEKVSGVLLGTTEEPQLTQQSKETFLKHALNDEETGERYLDEEHFVNAIAPEKEDYVSAFFPSSPDRPSPRSIALTLLIAIA